MNEYLIKEYIKKLEIDDIKKFAKKKNISITDTDAIILYTYAKNHYQEIIDGKWFRWSELLYDNNFIIVYGENDCLYDAIQLIKQNKMCAVSVKLIDEVDYHSTQLREKIKNGQSIIEETNERVQNFITENKLYY